MRGGSRLAGKRGGHGTDSSSDDIDSDDDDDDFVSCSSDDDFIVDDDDSDLGSCRPKKTKGKGKSRRRKDVLDSDSEDSAVAVTDESHETTAEDTDGADWWTWGGEDIQVGTARGRLGPLILSTFLRGASCSLIAPCFLNLRLAGCLLNSNDLFISDILRC